MRWMGAALLALGVAGTANGQVAWLGASWGASWEWQAPSSPGQNFLHSSDGAPAAFLAFPITDDTLFRLRAADLPHVTVIDGVSWPARYRAYTAGIDYLLEGTFGTSVLSAGFGSYKLDLKAKQPPAGVEETKLGWYLGVGEWFNLTRRTWVTAEVAMHRTQHTERPQILTANLGLALRW